MPQRAEGHDLGVLIKHMRTLCALHGQTDTALTKHLETLFLTQELNPYGEK